MVFRQMSSGNVETKDRSYAEMWCDLLDGIHADYLPYLEEVDEIPAVRDPMLGNNVAHNWERTGLREFHAQAGPDPP